MRLIYSTFEIVSEGQRVRESGRDFYVPAHKHYTFRIKNTTMQTLDYVITIDGESCGGRRVDPYATIVIDQPNHAKKQFYFIPKSDEPALAGKETGILQVDEYLCVVPPPSRAMKSCLFSMSYDTVDGDIQTDGGGDECGATVLMDEAEANLVRAKEFKNSLVCSFYFNMKLGKPWTLL